MKKIIMLVALTILGYMVIAQLNTESVWAAHGQYSNSGKTHEHSSTGTHSRSPQNTGSNNANQEILASFQAKNQTINGQTVIYQEGVIKGSTNTAPILVVYLHGMSGRGSDNTKHMKASGISATYNYLKNKGINAVMLVPQCPQNYTWSGVTGGRSGGNRNSTSTQNKSASSQSAGKYNPYVKGLIDYYISSMNIDRSRIYIMGVSTGGGGVWNMLSDYPNLFAGALAASGNSQGTNQTNLLKTPVYATIGSAEGQNTQTKLKSLTDYINANGGKAKFDILDGLEHPQACAEAFSTKRLDWVFSQKK